MCIMALDNDDPYPFNRKDHPYPEPYEDGIPVHNLHKPKPSEKQPDLWESPARPHHKQESELVTLESCAIMYINKGTQADIKKAMLLLECLLDLKY